MFSADLEQLWFPAGKAVADPPGGNRSRISTALPGGQAARISLRSRRGPQGVLVAQYIRKIETPCPAKDAVLGTFPASSVSCRETTTPFLRSLRQKMHPQLICYPLPSALWDGKENPPILQ